MHPVLRALCIFGVSALATLPIEAQDSSQSRIVAPAPLSHPLAVRATREVPVRIPAHSYAGSGTPIRPSLWVVNGTPLGLQSDGSIDQAAAQRELGKIRCRDVVSIDVLKGAAATTRFGLNVPDGVALLVVRSPSETGDEFPHEP